MIVRKQQIRTTAEEVSLMLSYSLPDVKKAMQHLFSLLATSGGNAYAASAPLSEMDILHFFANETFVHFPSKYKEQLSSWAFAMSIKHKFVFSSEDPTVGRKTYFLSEKLKCKIGRPRLNEEDWE